MQKTLTIPDKRMLELADLLQQRMVIRYKQEMWDTIEVKKQAISNIRKGLQHFTVTQIQLACRHYNVDANWILGIDKKTKFPQTKTQTKTIKKRQKNVGKINVSR